MGLRLPALAAAVAAVAAVVLGRYTAPATWLECYRLSAQAWTFCAGQTFVVPPVLLCAIVLRIVCIWAWNTFSDDEETQHLVPTFATNRGSIRKPRRAGSVCRFLAVRALHGW